MTINTNCIPQEIKRALDQYLDLVDLILPEKITGFYLIGSLGLDDYISGKSDIDFVAISNNAYTQNDLYRLLTVHNKLKNNRSIPPFDGIYITWSDLLDSSDKVSAPYFLNNKFHVNKAFAANPVTWYMLKHHVLTIRGTSQVEVNITINELREWCKINLNTYWANWITKSQNVMSNRIKTLRNQEIAWGVLGIVRLYATIKSEKIISKSQAGFYALEHFDNKWRFIINDALCTRIKNREKYYLNPFKRRKVALDFMEKVLEKASEL